MNRWTEIIDHGDDPGRYTLINGRGQVLLANENGKVIYQRTCTNPYKLLHDLIREDKLRIVKPALQVELLNKINRFLKPDTE